MSSVLSISFSSDGNNMLSIHRDGTIKVWNISLGAIIDTFSGYDNMVMMSQFLPGNRQIIGISDNGTIYSWDFPSLQRLINETHEHFKNRKLTPEERKKYYLE